MIEISEELLVGLVIIVPAMVCISYLIGLMVGLDIYSPTKQQKRLRRWRKMAEKACKCKCKGKDNADGQIEDEIKYDK